MPEVRPDPEDDSELYRETLELSGLVGASRYEVTVTASNMFGQSRPGPVFVFSTKGAGRNTGTYYSEICVYRVCCAEPVQQPMVVTAGAGEVVVSRAGLAVLLCLLAGLW